MIIGQEITGKSPADLIIAIHIGGGIKIMDTEMITLANIAMTEITGTDVGRITVGIIHDNTMTLRIIISLSITRMGTLIGVVKITDMVLVTKTPSLTNSSGMPSVTTCQQQSQFPQ